LESRWLPSEGGLIQACAVTVRIPARLATNEKLQPHENGDCSCTRLPRGLVGLAQHIGPPGYALE